MNTAPSGTQYELRRGELVVALLNGEPFGERPGEAGNNMVLAGQSRIGLRTAIPAGESRDPQDVRVGNQIGVEVIDLGEGQLQHDVLISA